MAGSWPLAKAVTSSADIDATGEARIEGLRTHLRTLFTIGDG